MAKAILELLEMPESCMECMFKECLNRTTSVEVSRCIILHKMHVPGSYCPAEGRQADCPLRLVEGKDEQTNVKCRYCNSESVEIIARGTESILYKCRVCKMEFAKLNIKEV